MIALASCPCCQSGQLGFRLCADRESVVILCDDCALVWTHPSKITAEHARDPVSQEFSRQLPGIQLQKSRWATAEEIHKVGWSAYVLKPTTLSSEYEENS